MLALKLRHMRFVRADSVAQQYEEKRNETADSEPRQLIDEDFTTLISLTDHQSVPIAITNVVNDGLRPYHSI